MTKYTDVELLKSDMLDACKTLARKRDRLMTIRSRAYGVSGISYDRERVQTSNHYDPSKAILDAIEAEEDVNDAKVIVITRLNNLTDVMNRAGFDNEQQAVWIERYAHDRSLGQIGKKLKMTRSHVQYLLGHRADTAINNVLY